MAEVILATDELTVIGGPEEIQLAVDFGPQGVRGSYIFAGNGNPNEIEIGQTPNINDMYIDINPNSTGYTYMYQYQSEPGGSVWNPIVRINPALKPDNNVRTFIDGSVTIQFPVSSIVDLTTVANLTSANFNIQYNILNANPLASSMTVGDLVTSPGVVSLPITINAIEYSGGSWINLSGDRTVHLFISVV